MLVSYIIPSYNHDKFIIEALNSIKADLFCDHEIIILDDGSTDQSVININTWMAQNSDLNVQLIQQTNKGVCRAINKLIGSSQGDFIRLVASDDQIIKGSTKSLIAVLEAQPEKLVAFGDTQTIDINGTLISESHIDFLKKNKESYKADLQQAIISEWAVAGPVLVYRKGFMDHVGKYDESILIEDWNMYLRLAGMNKLAFLDQVVARYRIHGTNTSMTRNTEKRIKNLQSQYVGGAQNLKYFTGKHLTSLKAQLFLIEAKIAFLKKDFVGLGLNMCKWILSRSGMNLS